MQLLIVTGMSGSGKSSVMDVMEDIGFYCIDNIPPKLITQFVDLCRQSESDINKIAVAVDIRSGDMFTEIFRSWQDLKRQPDVDVKILFIEASHDVLLKRYKETRRKHPLSDKFNGSIHDAINYEWSQLSQLREIADKKAPLDNETAAVLANKITASIDRHDNDTIAENVRLQELIKDLKEAQEENNKEKMQNLLSDSANSATILTALTTFAKYAGTLL